MSIRIPSTSSEFKAHLRKIRKAQERARHREISAKCNEPLFSLSLPVELLRTLKREEYRKAMSWLRHARRMILMSIEARR